MRIKNSNFINLFMGQVVSFIGSMIYSSYVGFYVLEESGSISLFGVYMSVVAIIQLVLRYFAAVFVESKNKVKVIVICDIIMGSALLFVFILFKTTIVEDRLFFVIILNLVLTVVVWFFWPASTSLYPMILNGHDLKIAYSYQAQLSRFAAIIGIFLGGLLFQYVSIETILLVNGLSFLISAFFEHRINVVSVFHQGKESFKSMFTNGIRFVISKKVVAMYLLLIAFLNIVAIAYMNIIIRYLILEYFELKELYYSFTVIIYSIIVIVTANIVSKLNYNIFKVIMVSLIMQVTSIVILLFILKDSAFISYFIILISVLVMQSFMTVFNIPTHTAIMSQVPKEYLSRFSGILALVTGITAPIAYTLYGYLLEYHDYKLAVIISVVIYIIGIVIVILNRDFKNLKLESDKTV